MNKDIEAFIYGAIAMMLLVGAFILTMTNDPVLQNIGILTMAILTVTLE
jgi:CDP-diglyceride synthetase